MKTADTSGLPGRPLGGVGLPYRGLSAVRILDFSRLLPGPYATQVLREMGCRVTRVELPYFGDPLRDLPPKIDGVGSVYWAINRGKKRLCFDFRKPAGMRRLRRLIGSSDVLVEGFRPGLMDRIGLGFREVRKLNARLVYCSITGYPPEGPWSRRAGHDLNFLAMSGFLGLGDCEGKISFPSAQPADLAGSMAAVSGILAGLVERGKTGRGRHVRISIAEAVHSWLIVPLSYLRSTGAEPSLGTQWWNGGHPFYRLYDTQDGRKVAVAAIEKSFALALLDALELQALKELADDPLKNSARLIAELERTFMKATSREWERTFKDKDCCVSPVCGLPEAVEFLRRSD